MRRVTARITARVLGGARASRSFRVRLVQRPRPERRSRVVARTKGSSTPGRPLTTAPLVGVSDQEPSTFGDPRFAALPIAIARVIVPWDVQRSEPDRLDAWLSAAREAGAEPLVALEHARGDRCPASPCRLPAAGDYEAAVRALVRRHPSVTRITPWNEPNHASQPTAGAPRRAAAYYDAARAACPRCTLVAGDALDAPGFLGWLAEYRRALSEAPTVWGLHNYFDTTYGRSDGVDGLLGAVSGEVWLTETGGIVSHRGRDGRVNLPASERRAALGVERAIGLADARAERVRRVYVYQWRAAPEAAFDAGLLAPDGTPRPAYSSLRRALAERLPDARPRPTGRAGTPRIALSGRATLSGRRLRLPLACAAYDVARCVGRLRVESASWRTGTLTNGHPGGRLIRPATRPVRLPGAQAATVSVRLARRPSPRSSLRLRVSLEEPGGSSELVVAAVRLR